MGKLKVVKTYPLATVQDFGRFGHRRYGIPQSGAMDKELMAAANQMVGNPDSNPVIEFAAGGMKMEVMQKTTVSSAGAGISVNGREVGSNVAVVESGDILEVSAPHNVYAYLGIGGLLEASEDFGSCSTYLPAGFGGIEGRAIQKGDILKSSDLEPSIKVVELTSANKEDPELIRIMKGPEWGLLKELPEGKTFKVDPASNRMGIRLTGELAFDFRELVSSAVVPGTIQLPPDGQPIILMNDCQTTGGYPRIAKVLYQDMGKLAQVKSGRSIAFVLS